MASDKRVLAAIERFLHARDDTAAVGSEGACAGEARAATSGRDVPEAKRELLSEAGAWRSGGGIKRIVVAVDHPDHPAIASALALAKPFGAEVVIVHVLDPMAGVVSEAGYVDRSTIEAMRAHARDLLGTITAKLPENALAFAYLLEGSPSEEIVRTARDFDADLIVIGTHRRGPLKRFFLGSVSQAVIRKAHCPVLLVSETAAVAEEHAPQHA